MFSIEKLSLSTKSFTYQATQNPILEEMLYNIRCRCPRLWDSALKENVPIPEVIHQLKEI